MPRVLVIENDTSLRMALQEGLTRRGLTVETAENTRAVSLMERDSFDVIVTSILPSEEDDEILASAARLQPDTPVVVLTGEPGPGGPDRARELGVFACLVKPVGLAELCAAIERALGAARPRRL